MIHVLRPIEDVFAFVGDLETAPQWVPDLVSMRKVTEGAIAIPGALRARIGRGWNEAHPRLHDADD